MKRRISDAFRIGVVAVAVVLGSLAPAAAWAVSYEYDALGRITKVTYDDGSYVVYTYDAAGNRITVSSTKTS